MFAIRVGQDRQHLPGKFWTQETAERFAADCSAHDCDDGQGGRITYAVEEMKRLAPMLPAYRRRVSTWQEGRRLLEHPRRLRLPSAEQWQAVKVLGAVALEVMAGAGGMVLLVAIGTAKL